MAVTLLSFLLTISFSNAQTVSCSGGDCFCPSTGSGTCTLSCMGKDICKDATIVCRAGDPCTVLCYGESSCEGNTVINGFSATDVTVSCSGQNACKGNTVINCGTGACNLQCGSSSCEDTTVTAPFATSLSCSGSCSDGKSIVPFANPTPKPTTPPSRGPTLRPTPSPTVDPTPSPTPSPTDKPTLRPTNDPTPSPTPSPTLSPSNPTAPPSNRPTLRPTANPSIRPTLSPSSPTTPPTKGPSKSPTPPPVAQPLVANGNAVEVVSEDHAATLYIFIACGVLIICGSAVCCLGIYVHYTSKRRHVKDLHGDELEMHKAMSRSPRSFASARSHARGHSDSNGLYATVPMGRQPEPDGLMASQMTVPRRPQRGQQRVIYQSVGGMAGQPRHMAMAMAGVGGSQEQALDDIRNAGHAQRRRKKRRKQRRERERQEEEEEESDSKIFNDLASCGTGDGKVDEVRTMHQAGASSTAVAAYARAQDVCRVNLGVPPPQQVSSPTHVPPYLADNHGVSSVLVRDEAR